MLPGDANLKLDYLRSRSNTVDTQVSNVYSNTSTNSNATKKNRKNLVLSTSFLSTKKLDNGPHSPASPLQGRWPRSAANKTLVILKNEVFQFQQELASVKKKKEDAERLKKSSISNIYSGTYSTSHLEKHSMRIKANTQIREFDHSIKKLEKSIIECKLQYEQTLKSIEPTTSTERKFVDPMMSSSREDLITAPYVADDDASAINLSRNLTSDTSIADIISRHGDDNISYHSLPPESDLYFDGCDSPFSNDEPLTEQMTSNKETATWLVSDYMQSLQNTNTSVDFIIKKANDFVELLIEHSELRKELILPSFMTSLQNLLLQDDKLIAAAAFRICRYLIDGTDFIDHLLDLRLDAFIVISLSKENSFQVEREQALKLARSFIDYDKLPKCVLQGIISCIEKQDDMLKNMALETLLELCFINPQLVTDCQGMRVLENLLHDYSSFPLASIILDTILKLMSTEGTRKYFLSEFNISVLATVFSDTNTNSNSNLERLQNSSILISKALKHQDGCKLFSIDKFKPLKELISFFQIPLCAQYLIDIFLDVLRIKHMEYFPKSKIPAPFKSTPSLFIKESMPINQHVALMIIILNNCDFVNQLLKVIDCAKSEEIKGNILPKARYLLTEYLNLAMNLVDVNSSFINEIFPQDVILMFKETYPLEKMTYIMNKNRNTFGLENIDYNNNVKKISQGIKASALIRQVDDLKFRKMVFDSKVLQVKDFSRWNWNVIQELLEGPLTNSRLMEELGKTKFIRKLLVFYRPLRQRFSNVDKKSRLSQKYVQVGCNFFNMLTSNLEGMKILMDDTKIIPQLASLLFRAMEGKTEGNIFNEYSLKNKMVTGYFDFIGELTKSNNGIKVLDRWNFFTVIYKMFQIESKLSLKFLMLMLPVIDLRYSLHCRTIMGKALVVANEQVRLCATQNMGKKLKESTELTVGGSASFVNISKQPTSEKPWIQKFILELLTRQLFDLSPKVVAVADQSLYEYVISSGNSSQELISWLKKTLNQMVFISSPIIFELMKTQYGFQILNEINYVEEERLSWMKHKNREYVTIIEDYLHATISTKSGEEINDNSSTDITKRIPLHFYGSLAQTDDGISLITSCGDLVRFLNCIKKYISDIRRGEETATPENNIELKSCLWCCGFIGSTTLGIGLLENYSIVQDFITISYEATVTSVRYTAFFVLGLIAKTKEGCETLDELGWSCCLNVFGEPVGIALPKKIDKFLSYKENEWKMQEEYDERLIQFDTNTGDLIEIEKIPSIELSLEKLLNEKNKVENPLMYQQDIINIEKKESSNGSPVTPVSSSLNTSTITNSTSINNNNNDTELNKVVDAVVENVCELGNHILTNKAIKELTRLKEQYMSIKLFENEIMFLKIFDIISKYRFKPSVRKFLMGLFINKVSLGNVIRYDRR